jgi:hypothetical protein
VVKLKPLDEEVLLMMASLAAMCGPTLEDAFRKHQRTLEYAGTHRRELGVYRQADPRFLRHVPKVYQVLEDDAREAHVLVLEKLNRLFPMNDVDEVSGWTPPRIRAALEGAAALHAVWWGRDAELLAQPWLGPVPRAAQMEEMADLWRAMASFAEVEHAELVEPGVAKRLTRMIDTVRSWWTELERGPRTLIHNDFNPRNLALRPEGAGLSLVAFDWELATLGVPQRDLAEFLTFVLPPTAPLEDVTAWVEHHRRALERETGATLDPKAWRRGYALSLQALAVQRFSFYVMAHGFRQTPFLDRVYKTLWHLLSLEGL